ncbi:MAG TPA: DUF4012 domain-containing protein [Patescibacteria group bacterium]|nr:DUF4012 domain-containing protein [Patescibacteria group bacterium]
MTSPFRNIASRLSDMRPSSRPKPVVLPETEFDTMKEWYAPPSSHMTVPPVLQKDFLDHQEPELQPPYEEISRLFLLRSRLVGLTVVILVIVFGGVLFFGHTLLEMKQNVEKDGEKGYRSLALAVESMQASRFDGSLDHFNMAYQAFSRGADDLTSWGGVLVDMTQFIPSFSKIASGKYALLAGQRFAAAGIPLARIAEELTFSQAQYAQGSKISLLDFLTRIKIPLQTALAELTLGNQALEKIDLDDIPKEKRDVFLGVRQNLPILIGLMQKFEHNEALLEELMGGNGPRKYLFLFQNNHELRATGGFIGSYALLDINDGVVRRFFVDGIFNPDGQLKEKIVPPKPIQKISASWSLHDSNWFPDFPTSAEKAIFFYEKTGGPTVDGVITLTPTVMQKLLTVVGPITLPQYGLVVDAHNFIPVIQEQVETKYDKEENQPKKILADLSLVLMEKVFASQDRATLYRIAEALVEGLNEKHMLLYARHPETMALIDAAGWSGKVLPATKDYLSVIHTNINGYKTDGVIDETIHHQADIDADGSIVDTVTITRTHRGGQTAYEWWNKVNADYMRVYVPKGSELLSAKGTTWEFPEDPLDYNALGFRRDADIEREEKGMVIDEKSGTRVYEEADKTVFGAWVYVSPQELVTVEYRYRLPFTLALDVLRKNNTATHSVLYQKQSGSVGSELVASVIFPDSIRPIWQVNGNLLPYGREWQLETTLTTDVFAGMVFGSAKE